MLKIGITGVGFMGMIHWLAYQRVENVKVVALCESFFTERLTGDWTKIKGNFGPAGADLSPVDLTGVKTYTNFDEMIQDPDIDVVDICLPPGAHAEYSIKALNAGKHVFCEKPIALDAKDGAAMVEAQQKSGKQLMIGHVLPFFDAFKFLCDVKADGRYGKCLGGNFLRVTSEPTWLPKFYTPSVGGPCLDLHVHDAHFIRMFFGAPKAVQCVGRLYPNEYRFPLYFNSQFLYDDPDMVVTATSGNVKQQGRPFQFSYEVHFEKATVFVDCFNAVPVTVLTEDGGIEKPEFAPSDDVSPFAAEMTEARDCFLANKPSALLDGVLARDALTLCHREIDSIRDGGKRVEF